MNNLKKDENICPFCNGENKCMAYSEDSCWCSRAEIPSQLLDLIPSHLQKKACVCSHCIDLYNKNPDDFKAQYSKN